MPDYDIAEVTDLDAELEDLYPMVVELNEHHRPQGLPPLKEGYEQVWRAYIAPNPDRLLLIARFQDDAIGYMSAVVRRSASTDEVTGFIEDAYVRPVARRFGVGQAMLDRTEAWCRDKGLTTVRLNVLAANEIGLSFWRKGGYEPFSYTVAKTLVPS